MYKPEGRRYFSRLFRLYIYNDQNGTKLFNLVYRTTMNCSEEECSVQCQLYSTCEKMRVFPNQSVSCLESLGLPTSFSARTGKPQRTHRNLDCDLIIQRYFDKRFTLSSGSPCWRLPEPSEMYKSATWQVSYRS